MYQAPSIHDGIPTEADDGPCAFRAAEKAFKLRRPEPRERRRGCRQAPHQPPDMYSILDFRKPGTIPIAVLLQPDGEKQPKMYGLTSHPGFSFVPGGVPPDDQHSFLKDLAGMFLEPPAATNHTAAHGPLPGLWRAAQQGLRLREEHAQEPAAGSNGSSDLPADRGSRQSGDENRAPGQRSASRQLSSRQQCEQSSIPLEACSAEQLSISTWTASGGGKPAGKLLQKLRWATIGPRYDWTSRMYDYESPYNPLPPYGAALACRLAAQAQQAAVVPQQATAHRLAACFQPQTAVIPVPLTEQPQQQQAPNTCEEHCSGVCPAPKLPVPPCSAHSSQEQQPVSMAPPPCGAAATAAASALHQHEACAAANPGSAMATTALDAAAGHSPYRPDAALLCLYREGDTLCGHQDDVERDLSQPIVSLSLGCSAVLLLGGNDRQQPPVAMYVRHGDVIILTGAARMYYHGVPRVFDDGPGQHSLQLEELPDGMDEFLRHTRVNISIRAVS